MSDLNTFMAAVRMAETGSYQGDYQMVGQPIRGARPLGAYQIMSDDWPGMAAGAGLAGADWRNPQAQDAVAGHWMNQYYKRYGSWDLTATAWYGGQESADVVATRGYEGVQSIQNQQISRYVESVNTALQSVPAGIPLVAPQVFQSGTGWIHPVAGDNDWSAGSFRYQRTASQQAAGKTPIHEGIDVYAARGTPVLSPVSGTVISEGHGTKGGNFVKIKGDDGITYYMAHMAGTNVERGQQVRAGVQIGTVGATGNAKGTSPHLHFTMKDSGGKLINPSTWLTGANLAGGQFGGVQADLAVEAAPTNSGAMAAGMFTALATGIAGGERADYRTMGEPMTEATNEVIAPTEDVEDAVTAMSGPR